ncbi:BON domain-containing protein [Oxalobacteraceae bacterium R-40]|uniref:BON domain-containing protein n=1 Tax=Keguizhuia sedimenti TaxID=3064264 RepID=A0ABU1BKE8_9BURK|nr:BON domain-containing protein [Oxalobacteraceae bacterium R-40]
MKKITLALMTSVALLAGCQTMSGPDPVAKNVEAALKKDEYVKKFDIKAANDNGKVTLTGKVDNEFQQYQSGAVAKKVEGVKSIDNKIKVE